MEFPEKPEPRDFKYFDLVTAKEDWHPLIRGLSEVKSECLKPCADAFRFNLIRTSDFAMLPAEVIYQSRRNLRVEANAIFRTTGNGDMDLKAMVEFAYDDATRAHVEKQVEDDNRMPRKERDFLVLKCGVEAAEIFCALNKGFSNSMDALLTSIVLESWLFFEAMCSDLWAAGVDNGGKLIRGRMALNKQWERDRDGMQVVNLPEIQSNAQTNPGSFWRETGMVSFQRLRSIKSYFGIAFGSDAEKLFEKASNGYVNALNEVRNCITHSAGKIDSQFKAKMGDRFPEFIALNKGDRLFLDGALVRKLRNASAATGLALLQFVDEALQRGD